MLATSARFENAEHLCVSGYAESCSPEFADDDCLIECMRCPRRVDVGTLKASRRQDGFVERSWRRSSVEVSQRATL